MCLMQIIHIAMHIIPRHSMLNLGTILGENNTLMVETCSLVSKNHTQRMPVGNFKN